MNRHLTEEDIQITSLLERCSTLVAIRKMGIIMSVTAHASEWLRQTLVTTSNTKSWRGCRETGPGIYS